MQLDNWESDSGETATGKDENLKVSFECAPIRFRQEH